ncbi:NADH-quinone oxidoreductase subunit C [Streptomyces sp. NPDC001852]|uniref:NADH-quinone oxidoreductase subunit C n=1 Tax=Streptomyces sp. NPDC001852 TaxID=3364619 RepID=UPI0036C50AFD
MSTVGWLPAPVEDLFGTDATAEESYDLLTVDVPPSSWLTALETARSTLGCTYFDWLSAVDEPGTGFRVSAHVVALGPVRRLLVRTTVPHEAPALPSAVGVYAGAAWHERETHEMFGVVFEGHPGLEHLLLPETFEGHPLRKDFVLAARVAKAWPGAKEPGESEHGGPKRRQMLPPGVPDPNEWGPLKGQLPPAPARPARGAGRAAGERPAARTGAAGDRPVRRTRTAAEGSASQTDETAATAGGAGAAGPAEGAGAVGAAGARPRRMRSASEGSVSQTPVPREAAELKQTAAEGDAARAAAVEGPAAEASVAHEPGPAPARPRRARSASEGSATQRAETPEQTAPAAGEPTAPATGEGAAPAPRESAAPDSAAHPTRRSTAPRSSDAPWHHARPAFEEPEQAPPTPEQGPTAPEPAPEEPERTHAEPGQAEQQPEPPAAAGDDLTTGDEPGTPDEPGQNPEPDSGANPEPTDDNPAGGPQ